MSILIKKLICRIIGHNAKSEIIGECKHETKTDGEYIIERPKQPLWGHECKRCGVKWEGYGRLLISKNPEFMAD